MGTILQTNVRGIGYITKKWNHYFAIKIASLNQIKWFFYKSIDSIYEQFCKFLYKVYDGIIAI